jgi:hypothetical protein
MKEQIATKLNKISNLEDRLLLKNILNDVFLNLYEHSENMYQQLEDRVFSEMDGVSDAYDVYSAAVSRQKFDPVHYFLRPMDAADVAEIEYDLAGILSAETKDLPLLQVFFSCEYELFSLIINGGRIFHGTILTDRGSIAAEFTLRLQQKYIRQIKRLYETFINNNVSWKTVNNPYAFRFAEVLLTNCQRLLEDGETVSEIQVDFEEYGQYVHYDIIPLWNIEELKLKSIGFPMPCEDKINFEHIVSLEKIGVEHGYLAAFPNSNISYVRRTKNDLVMAAPTEIKVVWDIMRVIRPSDRSLDENTYPLLSNAKRQAFSDSIAPKSLRVIRTAAELRRLISSFVSTEKIVLSRTDILPYHKDTQEPITSYGMNCFIEDEIRRVDAQHRLVLYFSAEEKDNFVHDLMSFVVSEVQLYYPDYKCEGVIL